MSKILLNRCNVNFLIKIKNSKLANLPTSHLLKNDGIRNSSLAGFTNVRYNSGDSTIFNYISNCAPTEYVKQGLISIHEVSGLPWWATIICTTVFFRSVITFPLAVYQNYILAKMENVSLIEMPEIAKEVQKEIAIRARQRKWSEKQASISYKFALKKRWDALVIRDNCHPFKATITLWFQLPAWVFLSAALRNLAYMLPLRDGAAQVLFMELAFGGCLWIPNLTEPDGTLILPLILGLSNLAIIEMQAMKRLTTATRLQRYATNFFRMFSILIIPISATVPSAVVLYWTTSSLMGLGQNLLLMSNRVRFVFGIPDTPSTLDHPYLQLKEDIKKRGKHLSSLIKRP